MTLEKTHLAVGAGETGNEKDPVLPKGRPAPPNTPLTRQFSGCHLISLLQKGETLAPEEQMVASPSNFAG